MSDTRIIVRQFDNTRWHSNGVAGDTVCVDRAAAELHLARILPHLAPGQRALILSRQASADALVYGRAAAGNNRRVHVLRRDAGTYNVAMCGARIPKQPQTTQERLPKCHRCFN